MSLDKITLRFTGGWGLMSPLVSWYTKSPYTHVDIVFPAGYFSSMPFKGVKVFDKDYIKPKEVKFVDVRCDRDIVMSLLKANSGAKYDWFAWLYHITGINVRRQKCWTCAGLFASVLNIGDRNTTPAQLYKRLQ